MYRILNALTRMLAPILAFTAEEIWSFMPHASGDDTGSVMFNEMPVEAEGGDAAFMERWKRLHAIRDDVQKALEAARTAKVIGSSLEAEVVLYGTGDLLAFMRRRRTCCPQLLIVSGVTVLEGDDGACRGDVDGLSVTVAHAKGEKCARCWSFSDTVGADAHHPTLCSRCAGVMKVLGDA